MNLTKETMLHMAIGGIVTSAALMILFSAGSMNTDEIEIDVAADAQKSGDLLFVSYMIHNTGDFTISQVVVSLPCCLHSKTITDPIPIVQSKEFLDIIPVNVVLGEDIIVQFDAYDSQGRHDVEIVVVTVD